MGRVHGEDNQEKCDAVFVKFEIYIDIKYRKQWLNIKICTMFNDKFSLFDDNKFDKYNDHWQQSLVLLHRNVKSLWIPFLNQLISGNDKISAIIMDYLFYDANKERNYDSESDDEIEEEICIIDNGKINENNCLLIASLIGIDDQNTNIISQYFDLLWKWFLSKELITFRKDTVDEKMVWRESTDLTSLP